MPVQPVVALDAKRRAPHGGEIDSFVATVVPTAGLQQVASVPLDINPMPFRQVEDVVFALCDLINDMHTSLTVVPKIFDASPIVSRNWTAPTSRN